MKDVRLITCAIAFASAASALADPVAHWDFHERRGNVVHDVSGNGHDGAMSQAKWDVTPIGSALWFDGESSEVTVPSDPAFSDTPVLTIEAIVRADGLPSGGDYPTIVGVFGPFEGFGPRTNQAFRLCLHEIASGPAVMFTVRTAGNTLYDGVNVYSAGVSVDAWVRLAGVFDHGDVRLYVDGMLAAEEPLYTNARIKVADRPLTIGYSIGTNNTNDDVSTRFRGEIAAVRVTRAALDPEDFLQLTPHLPLADSFEAIHPALWTTGSNGGGSASADGVLRLMSGSQLGGGTWAQSAITVQPEPDAQLVLDARCRLPGKVNADDDDGFWGFFTNDDGPHRVVAFRTTWENGFYASVRDGDAEHIVPIPHVDYTQWHDYRIVLGEGVSVFAIDGRPVATVATDDVPDEYPLRVRFDKTSPGTSRVMEVDRMSLALGGTSVFSTASSGSPRLAGITDVAPNPFNPRTTVSFSIESAAWARLALYDANGRLVRTLLDGVSPAGEQRVMWDGRDGSGHRVASGVYFVRLSGASDEDVRRVVMVR